VSAAGPSGPVTFWPRNLLIWASGFSIVLAASCLFGWFALAPHIRERFNAFQIITLIVVAGVLIGFMMALGLSKVTADREGLRIRNGISSRRLRWAEIGDITYRHGDPWAYVVLAGTQDDPVRRQLIAIQSTDGQRARDAVQVLRAMHANYTATQGD
jgi:hypothetical protein